MSSIYKRGRVYYAKVRCSSRKWIGRTCETHDIATAKAMGRMLDELSHRGKQCWDLLDAVKGGRLSLTELYEFYSGNRLEELRDRLSDVDLSPLVDEWLSAQKGRLSGDTIAHYKVHVRSLIPENKPFLRSALTFERLSHWLSQINQSSGTRRKYHAAMTGFCRYLRSRGVIRQSPMQDVKAPSAGSARTRYLDHTDVLSLVEALEEPYRTLVALVYGTGIEISAALSLLRRDIDFDRKEIHAHGTKTKTRDRLTTVEPWAMAYVRRHARRLLPNAAVFPGLNRWTVSDKHRAACKALGIENYQLRDSRHTYAVRAIRAGASYEAVAQQLGHADTTMVIRVYGRYKPTRDDLRNWHRIAEAQDSQKKAAK